MSTLMIMIQDASGILDQLAPLLNTVAVWLAVKIVTAIKKFTPIWILGVLVPLFSAAAAWVAGMINPDSNFWITLIVGFGSVFLNEMIKNLTTKKA